MGMSKKEQVAENLSQVLEGLREKNDWTQAELAERLAVSAMSIRRYEKKQIGKGLDFDFVAALARLAAIPEDSLYSYLTSDSRQAIKDSATEKEGGFLPFIASAEPAILAKLDEVSPGLGSARATELANYCFHFLRNDRLGQLEALIESCRAALAIDGTTEIERQAIKAFLKKVMVNYRQTLLDSPDVR